MRKAFEKRLKTALKLPEMHPDKQHFQAVLEESHRQTRPRRPISFWAFMLGQIRYTAWTVWLAQGAVLIALCLVLSAALGDVVPHSPQYAAALLCASAILVLLSALPFVQRGLRYKMHETEAATRFSSVKLLGAKLLIIALGNAVMLGCVFLLALARTGLDMGTIALYLLLPFLAVTSACLYLLGHVPANRFLLCCSGAGTAVFAAVLCLCRFYPEIETQTFSAGWLAACALLVGFCTLQLRHILRRTAYLMSAE